MTKKIYRLSLFVSMILFAEATIYPQCRLHEERIFTPQNKTIKLVAHSGDADGSNKIVFFKTSLRVNTDGAPNSYHPQDLTGSVKAINNICNGVGVYQIGRNGRETKLECAPARRIFAQFRDGGWRVPTGHRISWRSVIAPRTEGGRTFPCVFRTGDFKDYFGSLTSLKNALSEADAGECGVKNQLDQRFIPAFVMPLGQNPLKEFGANVGDLLLAYNPRNNAVSAAIVGDFGPATKLGEGSVGLNMTLLARAVQPRTYQEALRLDTGNNEMLIAIIPGSKNFEPRKPFTKENIAERVVNWLGRSGFGTQADFVDFMKNCNQ